MIYDKLTNIKGYAGISPNLDIAIDYISTHDLSSLPLGRTTLAGDQVYINVMEAEASPCEKQRYEFHKNYMDLQIDLCGTEMIRIGNSADMTVTGYDPSCDFGTVSCEDSVSCLMGPGNFILCMTSEPHKPGILATQDPRLKKCVFKIYRECPSAADPIRREEGGQKP